VETCKGRDYGLTDIENKQENEEDNYGPASWSQINAPSIVREKS
jgi:hypothetical protein